MRRVSEQAAATLPVRLPLDFTPGTRSSYSSGGYEVLARVLELASGREYAALLRERILDPLGMAHSGHEDSREIALGRADAYVPGPNGIENAPLQDFSALVVAGSVWSTARNLRRFVDALCSGRLGEGPRQSWARGGRLDFNGRTGGFKVWAVWDSTSRFEAIFLSNLATGASDQLKRDILYLAAGRPVARHDRRATCPAAHYVLQCRHQMADQLGAFEQAVLLGIVRLGENAYGRAILKEVQARLERDVAAGAVHATLERLEKKGVISSRLGPGTPVRGGRARRFYHLQPRGLRALNDARAAIDGLWHGLKWPLREYV